ncbi:MAG: hypothetical protein UT50_C0028G0008 [Candidatus Moranbacteria bacterium GW2011_GWA2_39_41]|nr:MAG: hypothetical protein UT50_C0028G0008 [Candidatus Moranbacteria bacterium GW2011_GWA2_39_41]
MKDKSQFAIAKVMPGELNALVKNLMSQMKITDPNEAVRCINSGEWLVAPAVSRWREQNSILYFAVTSHGRTASQWIKYFGKRILPDFVMEMLKSPEFRPTNGVTTEVAVLRGSLYNGRGDLTAKKMFIEGERRKLERPSAEIACLIAEMFQSDEITHEMRLSGIIVMHAPIKYDGAGVLFEIGDNSSLTASVVDNEDVNDHSTGFAFATK